MLIKIKDIQIFHITIFFLSKQSITPKIVSFVNYPLTLTKLQLPPEIAQR